MLYTIGVYRIRPGGVGITLAWYEYVQFETEQQGQDYCKLKNQEQKAYEYILFT